MSASPVPLVWAADRRLAWLADGLGGHVGDHFALGLVGPALVQAVALALEVGTPDLGRHQ